MQHPLRTGVGSLQSFPELATSEPADPEGTTTLQT